MPLGMEVSFGPGDFVLYGDTAPSNKRTQHPTKFSAHVYCSQTAGWIKVPLGTEVGFCPGDFVLYGDTAPSNKRTQHPTKFSAHVYCGQTAGWMKIPLGTEVDPGPSHIVLNGDPAPPPPAKAAQQSPLFGPSVVATVRDSRPSQLLLSSCSCLCECA